ncbi:MAG: prepilin-type N-terminal cleavage/methylation domain-containing protein [Methylophaga sp.]|nr:prepilin-type N-terminal cleavage/methylation domain-containing protein [Methylophaga sp.]
MMTYIKQANRSLFQYRCDANECVRINSPWFPACAGMTVRVKSGMVNTAYPVITFSSPIVSFPSPIVSFPSPVVSFPSPVVIPAQAGIHKAVQGITAHRFRLQATGMTECESTGMTGGVNTGMTGRVRTAITTWAMRKMRIQGLIQTTKHTLQAGFTLLEMILVLFLISLMASTTLMITEGVEDQAKYDETKRRMDIMRKAIVGDPTRTVNGGPEISGFVADMGRLPECIAELLQAQNCANDSGLFLWQQDENSGIWSGWRGPYIQVLPERDKDGDGKPDIRFRDGYGNPDASNAQDSGWTFSDSSGTLSIISKGFDINNSNDDVSTAHLVVPSDYQVYLQNWDSFQVEFQNTSTAAITINKDSLRMKLSYAEDGSINIWPDNETDKNEADYLSATFPSQKVELPSASQEGSIDVTTGGTVTVPSGSQLGCTGLTLPSAGTVIFPSATSSSVPPSSTATIPRSHLNGSKLTIHAKGVIQLFDTTGLAISSEAVFAGQVATVPTDSIATGCDTLHFSQSGNMTFTSSGSSSSIAASVTATDSIAINPNNLSGNTLTITSDHSIILPAGSTVSIQSGLDLSDPPSLYAGTYSLIVACDTDDDNDGNRYDGECTNAENQAYLFQAPPRNPAITPPNPFIWTIQ